MSDENTNVRIKGTFLGQPIDVTISDEQPAETPEGEAPVDAPGPVAEQEASAAALDTSAEGEVVPADPAPAVSEQSDEPKNPQGNSEQL